MRVLAAILLPALFLASGCEDTSYPFDIVTDPFTFTYEITEDGIVDVLVLNSYVVVVRTLLSDAAQTAGSHSLSWDLLDEEGTRVPDGLYYIRIVLDGYVVETQMYEVHR